jgi:2-polyprenyl-3-methyl-5-hydroxy-6-metoxy-1,4-benzoquinol methylase
MDEERAAGAGYVLGHTPHEIERLAAQARLYEPFTEQLFRDAGIGEGMQVLDVGCGSGDVSFLVARMVGPTGQVVGVDQSPIAVETARQRAQDMHVSHARFLVGDVSEDAVEGLFDAAVGRFVLQFCPDPAAVLRNVTARVRPGGVVAFQEVDWSGCRSLPEVPTFNRCLTWGAAALRGSGADPLMGMQLFATFTSAGLPAPAMYLHAGVGAGQAHPIYSAIAGLMRSLLPAIESQGIATSDEVGIDTLSSRMGAEAVALGATIVWISVIGAASHTPAE